MEDSFLKKRLMTALAAGAVLAAMLPGTPALAQEGPWTVVADGLDAPRGMAFGTDGTLYVAVAGSGGEQCMEAPSPETGEPMEICVGPSGSVSAVDVGTGTVTPAVGGLPSADTPEGVLGTSDVAVDGAGVIYYLSGDGNDPDAAERAEGDLGGIVWKAGMDGAGVQIADLVAFEAANNPDAGELDSNPNGVDVADDGTLVIADAGANALLMVGADGTTSVAAVFPDTMGEMPAMPGAPTPEPGAEPMMIPVQAVPTSVTIGDDGAAYVTFLTGFPFTPGAATVKRVVAGEEPTVYAEGFTNVIDAEFASDGTLYVLEMATNGLLSGDQTGGLWSVPPGGGEATLVTTEGLVLPGGLAIGDDDSVYVANGGRFPGVGSIVKLEQ